MIHQRLLGNDNLGQVEVGIVERDAPPLSHLHFLSLVGHVGQSHNFGTLHVAEHAVDVGGSDEGAILGQHAHQRDAVTVGIHHFNLLRLSADGCHYGDSGQEQSSFHCCL